MSVHEKGLADVERKIAELKRWTAALEQLLNMALDRIDKDLNEIDKNLRRATIFTATVAGLTIAVALTSYLVGAVCG